MNNDIDKIDYRNLDGASNPEKKVQFEEGPPTPTRKHSKVRFNFDPKKSIGQLTISNLDHFKDGPSGG
eukprot:CAMPEP_0114584810 /NCGR_PEP_ID=MMETSP0125-20121206/8444_1 /TAXON_ID=485358 ORGANISM="Aristerostoma sp., Strain ATCC 50986" /NCGR_SAMPLE_ID=MMETSP0125 /ASSEMBLY_ACC=CAM_ASM_000245 /LENGTH=67 /DNA_ID=CAMNT_0001779441 /DNA_START=2457 /DNA_END=2660 /DNA_ORIENTATION=-